MTSSGAADQLTARERFYGLHARPFSLTPDLRFVFHSRSHSRAFDQVTEALRRREGLIVVTGEIGTGKTVLCRTLLETFEARTFLSVILDPCLTVDELIRQVLSDFGLMPASTAPPPAAAPEVTRHQLVSALQRFLATLIPLNAHAVIMIDEAQHLTPAVLEEIRLLSNFEADDKKLLQIVLVGQPNLEDVLRQPDMRQLDQRIARRCELHPLSPAEVQDYIGRRLMVAAEPIDGRVGEALAPVDASGPSERPQFTAAAIRAVASISGGIPRVINILCDRALEVGFEQQVRTVDRPHVLTAAERLKLPVQRGSALVWRAGLRTAAAVLIVLVAGLGVWRWQAARTSHAASAPAAAPLTARRIVPASAVLAIGQGSEPAAAPTGRYEISVAAFRTASRAADVAADLAAKGVPISTRFDEESGWHRIIAGPYGSAEDAAAAQQQLEQDGFPGTRISVRPQT